MSRDTDVFYQAGIACSLKYDMRRGSTTIGEMREHGTLGFGTNAFPGGEMVILEDGAYAGIVPDRVRVLGDDEHVPLGFMAWFQPDCCRSLTGCSYEELTGAFETLIREKWGSLNYFYMMRLCGRFHKLELRTTNRCLDEEGKGYSLRDFKTHEDIEGTMIGLWVPSYAKELNMPGWHFHFISEARDHVGHVISVGDFSAEAGLQRMTQWQIALSEDEEFSQIDFDKPFQP